MRPPLSQMSTSPPAKDARLQAFAALMALDPDALDRSNCIREVLAIIKQCWACDSVHLLEKIDGDDYRKYCPMDEVAEPIDCSLRSGYTHWVVEKRRYLLITHCDNLKNTGHGYSGILGSALDLKREAVKYVLLPPSLPPHDKHERSLLIYPLLLRNRIVGTIKLCSYTKEGAFGTEDVKALHSFSEALGILLRHYDLMDDLRRETGELSSKKKELETLVERLRLGEDLMFAAMLAHSHLHELEGIIFRISSTHELLGLRLERLTVSTNDKKAILRTFESFKNAIRDVRDSLKRMTRKGVLEAESLDIRSHRLKTILEDELSTFQEVFRNAGILEKHALGKSNVAVLCDKNAMRYVFRILINNAINAIYDSGRKGGILRILSKQDGSNVDLLFIDNGNGVEVKSQRRIFEAGFTTNERRGHGFGLFFARKIIKEQFNGSLRLDRSLPGKGATFRLRLPKSEE